MFPVNDLTVLIVTFKTNHKILDDCIKSIDGKSKIIIVENSKDEQFKKEYEKKFSNIEVFLSGKNLGYGGGNNFGLNLIKTNYALISNPDVVYEDDFFSSIDYYIKQNVDFDIMGPMYRREDYESHGHFDDLIKISPKSNSSTESSLVSAHWIVGCTMFLNLKKFKNRNLFDENFFLFFEEIDICRRLKIKNEKIYIDPKIKIYHEGAKSVDESIDYQVELTRNWHWMWSTFYYHKKYNGFFLSFIIVFPKLVSSFFRILLYFFVFNKKKRKIYFQRLNGLINSILGKKAWYRPTLD